MKRDGDNLGCCVACRLLRPLWPLSINCSLPRCPSVIIPLLGCDQCSKRPKHGSEPLVYLLEQPALAVNDFLHAAYLRSSIRQLLLQELDRLIFLFDTFLQLLDIARRAGLCRVMSRRVVGCRTSDIQFFSDRHVATCRVMSWHVVRAVEPSFRCVMSRRVAKCRDTSQTQVVVRSKIRDHFRHRVGATNDSLLPPSRAASKTLFSHNLWIVRGVRPTPAAENCSSTSCTVRVCRRGS